MATGALDANGIWQYGEDDSEATASALLNKLGQSTSNTVTRLESSSGLTSAQVEDTKTNLGIQQKISAGKTTNNSASGGTASGLYWNAATTVTFPVGRFTAAPVVTTNTDSSGIVAWSTIAAAPTTTGFSFISIRVSSYAGAIPVHWQAIQMTPTTGAG